MPYFVLLLSETLREQALGLKAAKLSGGSFPRKTLRRRRIYPAVSRKLRGSVEAPEEQARSAVFRSLDRGGNMTRSPLARHVFGKYTTMIIC
ncbi:MAG: hypothetical protein KME30_26880 [Iphinoe sp. HA4291-MV1]|nr:hypothetical protein [Iphinoe sp. HA4291-MV1]